MITRSSLDFIFPCTLKSHLTKLYFFFLFFLFFGFFHSSLFKFRFIFLLEFSSIFGEVKYLYHMNQSSNRSNSTERPCGLTALLPLGMSCRGRAEAFARSLQSRLRTLGTQVMRNTIFGFSFFFSLLLHFYTFLNKMYKSKYSFRTIFVQKVPFPFQSIEPNLLYTFSVKRSRTNNSR